MTRWWRGWTILKGEHRDIGADELLARLSGENAQVHVADPEPAVRAAWRRAIDVVRREHLVPDGMRLRHTGRDRGDLVIWLKPAGDAPPARPVPLLVPLEVVDVHPLLGSEKELGERLDVEPASLPRALRLLQVFIEAAEAGRCTVAWASAFSTLALERDGPGLVVRARGARARPGDLTAGNFV